MIRSTLAGFSIVAVIICSPAILAQDAAATRTIRSLAAYDAELDAWRTEISALESGSPGADALLKRLPRGWSVETPDRTWWVPADELLGAIDRWKREHDRASLDRALRWIDEARLQARGFTDVAATDASARARLDEILARREFRGVHGPTWFDEFRQGVILWILDLLGRLIGSSSMPTITRGFVYAVLALAVGLAAWTLARVLARRRSPAEPGLARNETTPPRPWATWLDEARGAASRAEWRDAVRLAYWTGIAFLEGRGAWRPDPSRTPREYVSLMSASGEDAPALRDLTRIFERVWYAADEANAVRFDEAISCLRTLGCPLP